MQSHERGPRADVESAAGSGVGEASHEARPGREAGARREERQSPSHIQSYLKGMDYPSTRDALVEHARGRGAPPEVIEALRGLPDHRYERVVDISKELTRPASARARSGRVSPSVVLSALRGITLPTDKRAIMDLARRHAAAPEVLSALDRIPERAYRRIVEITREIGRGQ